MLEALGPLSLVWMCLRDSATEAAIWSPTPGRVRLKDAAIFVRLRNGQRSQERGGHVSLTLGTSVRLLGPGLCRRRIS